MIQDLVGVHVGVSHYFKSGESPTHNEDFSAQTYSSRHPPDETPTVSEQVHMLRYYFNEAQNKTTDFSKVLSGELPLVIATHEASDILKIIDLKRKVEAKRREWNETSSMGQVKFVILGGSEAWYVAKELAASQISVIAMPRCTLGPWESQRCLVPSSYPSALQLLKRAGVNVGLAFGEDNFQRGLIWEAGWALADAPLDLSVQDVVGMVTWNIASAYGLDKDVGRIREGAKAGFVVYGGTPGELSSKPLMVVDGSWTTCNPSQR